ncbi:DUF1425 domain-containing protein [Ursidibacter sp. B-7004-1]
MKELRSFWLPCLFALVLTACANNPPSYLPTGTTPIVNVEAQIAQHIRVDAKPQLLTVTNQTQHSINVWYKLFWYDKDGVTQTVDVNDKTQWLNFWLAPQTKTEWHLTPPTVESVNYRVYLRGNR